MLDKEISKTAPTRVPRRMTYPETQSQADRVIPTPIQAAVSIANRDATVLIVVLITVLGYKLTPVKNKPFNPSTNYFDPLSDLWSTAVSRRQLLTLFGVGAVTYFLSGCQRRYVRPGQYYDLGDVRETLYPKKHLRNFALLLFHDPQGWAVMSTQCTYDGCFLTYQDEEVFLCSCCNSIFRHSGAVVRGPADLPLPWFSIKLQGRHLFANSGEQVAMTYRFTTPALEREAARLEKLLAEQGTTSGAQIPNVLLGEGDGDIGEQFRDVVREDQDSLHDLPTAPDSRR